MSRHEDTLDEGEVENDCRMAERSPRLYRRRPVRSAAKWSRTLM
jgi:hypothetical protein